MKTAAVCLSRQPLRPCGQTPWVVQARAAVAWAHTHNRRLLTSHGMQTWELLVTLARNASLAQTLYLCESDTHACARLRDRLCNDFDLDSRIVAFCQTPAPASPGDKRARLHLRDKTILEQADTLVPVSVRQAGSFVNLLQKRQIAGADIVRRFEIPYTARKNPLSYEIRMQELTRPINSIHDDFLIHWTRAAHGPWPTERPLDYYNAIIASTEYPRSAFASLCNILRTGLLVASNRHMPRGIKAVCFSAAPPAAFVSRMRWRKRYAEMSFEPYGIGLKREYAPSLGIRPVIYANSPRDLPPGPERWQYQSAGARGDWQAEHEFRCLGDCSIARLPPESMLAVCYTEYEARMIERRFGIRAVGFVGGK